MKHRRINLLLIVAICIATLIGFLDTSLRSHTDDLSKIARPIASLKGFGGWDYVWRTDHELEILQSYPDNPSSSSTAYRLRIPNGAPVIDSAINKSFRRFSSPLGDSIAVWRLSPDGQWLCGWERSTLAFYIFGLDGINHAFRDPKADWDFAWLPDSRHLVVLDQAEVARKPVVHSIDGHVTHKWGLPLPTVSAARYGIDSEDFLGVASDGKCVSVNYAAGVPDPLFYLCRFDPLAARPNVQNDLVTFPANARFNVYRGHEVTLSTDGSRIAWVLDYDGDSWFMGMVRRLADRYHIRLLPPPINRSLWISDSFGHSMRLVAVWREDDLRGSGTAYQFEWAPDGKRLSFRWNNPGDQIEEIAVN